MNLPVPAKVCLGCGLLGLVLCVANQLTAGELSPPLERAGVLASLLAVGLMLVAVLWTRALPEAAARVPLNGREGLELGEGLSAAVAEELGWGSQMLLTATPAALVLVQWQHRCLLRRGLISDTVFTPGVICRQAMARGRAISLVNLALYPGREEFSALAADLPAVVVQPLGDSGVLLVGGWAPRCFSRADLVWIEGWSQRLTERLAGACAPSGGPQGPEPGMGPGEAAAGS